MYAIMDVSLCIPFLSIVYNEHSFLRSRSRSRSRDRDRRRDDWGRGGGGGGGSFGGGFGGGGGGFGGRSSLKGKQPGGNLRKPRWDLSKLTPFEKNFYKPTDSILNRPQHEVEKYRSGTYGII